MISAREAVSAETATAPVRFSAKSWPLFLVTSLTLLLYRTVLVKLVHDWWDLPDFSHGFVVPFFSAFLVYRDRARLRDIPKAPAWAGLFLVAAALVQLIVGTVGAEFFLMRTSGIELLAGMALTFWGRQRLRALAFPIAFLLFAIPIPQIVLNQVTFPLQLLASQVAADVLPWLQVPVFREGNVIHLATMPLEVAEACSGIRSLLSLGALAVIYGFFFEKSVPKRIFLVLASIPIAVACNAVRIMGTGLGVQYGNPDKALGFFHEFSDWAMFLVALAMLSVLHKVISLIGGRREPA